MEKIIKKAIEGRWKHEGSIGYEDSIGSHGSTSKPESLAYVFLDPLFWQALGKACEWYKEDQLVYLIPEGMNDTQAMIHVEDNLGVPIKHSKEEVFYSPYKKGKESWKTHALHFHELNLTEGWGKAVDYLTNLIERE